MIHSLSYFQIRKTVLLTIVILLYVTSPGLTKFGSLYLLTTFTHFAHPCLWQPPVCSLYLSLGGRKGVGRFLMQVSSYGVCLSLSDLFHLAKCPQGPFMLSQICFTLIKSKKRPSNDVITIWESDNVKNMRIGVLTYIYCY